MILGDIVLWNLLRSLSLILSLFFRRFLSGFATMSGRVTYSREQLLSLRATGYAVRRSVPKRLSECQLWLGRRFRFRCTKQHVTPSPEHKRALFWSQNNGNFVRAASLNAQSAGNKSAVITDLINEHKLDVIAITEVWHRSSEDVVLQRCIPPGFRCFDAARSSTRADGSVKRGGGVALVYRDSFWAEQIKFPESPTSFEMIGINLSAI